MAEETLVAVFDGAARADAAIVALVGAGVRRDDVERHAGAARASSTSGPAGGAGFWATLFGGATTHGQNAVYDRTVGAGGEVITVLMQDGERDADRLMTILERFGPVDVAECASSHAASAGDRVPGGGEPSGQTLQLSEERLIVGKRAVHRGTTRLHRFVRTRAVERDVVLRDERVSVTRRPVLSGIADAGAFAGRMIEMTETAERVVISKVARVREEVVLHRDVVERIETVRENLRREDLEIDTIGPSSSAAPARSGS